MYAIAESSNDFNPANLSNPSSLQVNSQLVARGAGGRGEALGYWIVRSILSPILEILEIEVFNILYNPGNIGNWIFSIFSCPGNIGYWILLFSHILEIRAAGRLTVSNGT